jgi:hypothetical protein
MPAQPVLVKFHCPLCSAPQEVGLLAVSRAGFATCSGCGRKLKAAQVSQAIHSAPPMKASRAPGMPENLVTKMRILP